jgi:hypothetical protein
MAGMEPAFLSVLPIIDVLTLQKPIVSGLRLAVWP